MSKNKNYDKTKLFSLFDIQRKFVDLSIIECGREQCTSIKHVNAVAKKVYTIHIIESGIGFINYNGQEHELRHNDLFINFPNQLLEYYPDKDNPWSYFWIVFEGIQSDDLVLDTGLTKALPYIHLNNETDIMNYFFKAVDAYERKGEIGIESIGYLYLILAQLSNLSNKTEELELKQRYIKEAVMFIHFNMQFNITISDIAYNLRISPNYLSTIFKEIIGQSPKQYLGQMRMERAIKLLKRSNIKVKQVALDVGYKDQLHFSREFKKYWGYSPSLAKKELN